MTTQQQGLALPTVMVMLSVASLAALLAIRSLWVNDQLLNAQADHMRRQYFAEAVLPIAVQDITGQVTTTDSLGVTTPNLRHSMGTAQQTHVFFPNSIAEYDVVRQRLGSRECSAGICAPLSPIRWVKASDWKTQTASAMAISAADSPYGAGTAWYWVEVFPQETTHTFVYRITTLTQGVLPSSSTVLQALWTRNSPTSTTGQWLSWHVFSD